MEATIRVFWALCFALAAFDFHAKIVCDAATTAKRMTPGMAAKGADSTKITSRNSAEGGAKVFTIGTDVEGKSSRTCQCVVYHQCDRQDVYYPTASESHIKCGSLEACCTRPLYTDAIQNVTPSKISISNSNSTEICVAASQCDQTALADLYGMSQLIERSVFSDCPIGELMCPSDKVLPKVDNATTPVPGTAYVPDDCSCTPPVYCNADFGENLLKERMDQCDVGEVCCPKDLIHTILDPITPAPAVVNECGIRKEDINNRLAGGSETKFGEFPWMVLVVERAGNQETIRCGASLISASLVLTAAHCVRDKSMSSLTVRAGEYSLSTPSGSEELPHQDRAVRNVTVHHAYLKKIINDLALLEVDSPFQYASNVAPVCLPLVKSPYSPDDTSSYDLDRCVATGWGAKSQGDKSTQNTLSKIDLKIIPSDQCVATLRKSPLGPKFILHPSLICAIGAPGSDTCKGDGGGPLVCPLRKNPNKYVQVGVIAGGLECNSPFPSLYASLLLSNAKWITEEIYFRNIFEPAA